jgi:hypothetical protein
MALPAKITKFGLDLGTTSKLRVDGSGAPPFSRLHEQTASLEADIQRAVDLPIQLRVLKHIRKHWKFGNQGTIDPS